MGSNPACAKIFPGSSHTSDLKMCTPVATLPGAWHYGVSAGTGRPCVSILWLGETESLICNFCLSVALRGEQGQGRMAGVGHLTCADSFVGNQVLHSLS